VFLCMLSTRRVISSERFFGCRLGRKEIEKKTREKEWEGEKENIFATACLLAFDSRRRLVKKKKGRRRREKQKNKKKGLSAQAYWPLIDWPIFHRWNRVSSLHRVKYPSFFHHNNVRSIFVNIFSRSSNIK
jgi:hypothetical protein